MKRGWLRIYITHEKRGEKSEREKEIERRGERERMREKKKSEREREREREKRRDREREPTMVFRWLRSVSDTSLSRVDGSSTVSDS